MVILEAVVSHCFNLVESMQPPQSNIPLSTSESHPIRVDFVPAAVLSLPGQLGLTIAPGKQNLGLQFRWQRDLTADLDRLRDYYQTDVVISLIEAPEFTQLQIPHLREEVQKRGMRSRWFPIPDFSTPTSSASLLPLVEKMLQAVEQGQTVVVHCKGGLGRSGLVVASGLTTLGYSAEASLAIVRQTRPGSVETQKQEAFVAQFAREWATRDRG